MALAWVLNNRAITSALIGVRTVKQLNENIDALNNLEFSKSELDKLNQKAREGDINLWAPSSAH